MPCAVDLMKALIVSLDLLIASAILFPSLGILFLSARGAAQYVLGLAASQNRTFGTVLVSQKISEALDSLNANLSESEGLLSNMALANGVNANLAATENLTPCYTTSSICRFVTISGNTYLLVISNEGSGKP